MCWDVKCLLPNIEKAQSRPICHSPMMIDHVARFVKTTIGQFRTQFQLDRKIRSDDIKRQISNYVAHVMGTSPRYWIRGILKPVFVQNYRCICEISHDDTRGT